MKMTKQYVIHLIIGIISLGVLASCEYEESGDYLSSEAYYDEGMYVNTTGDQYNEIQENPFVSTVEEATTTFSIDADGASYANVKRFIEEGQMPPKNAVRIEELINYFPMYYADQHPDHPLSVNGELSDCPWAEGHQLLRIGVMGDQIPRDELPGSNIVLLIDVSGSMTSSDKLKLLVEGFQLMVDKLREDDRVAIVIYAGSVGVHMESTSASEKDYIKGMLSELTSGGSTAGAAGIRTAYEIAEEHFIEGGNNRIILGTDGDFNVGSSSQEELVQIIEEEREKGIFLTVVGVGRGNLNDGMMEQVANHGNGTYEYINDLTQAKKVFVDEFHKFYPAAQDVKVQVTFNPDKIASYRLIGYENRALENEDFENDEEDAGELSVGQSVTALYELIPAEEAVADATEALNIDFRYKLPTADSSIPLTLKVFDKGKTFAQASESMRFAGSVAAFGLLLRDSEYKGTANIAQVLQWAEEAKGEDPFDYRAGFIDLLRGVQDIQ
ncbi:VWA domain-containing protein [Algivirga pacifica]|uniref:VWA domain-containing protein n=1 Tax=Algivirga pacifica TaxID=1162670 RepID=A0ABP9D1U2_9BACT